MTSAERSIFVEVINELDEMRQVLTLIREEKRAKGKSQLILTAFDERLSKAGHAAARGRELVDQAWMEQSKERRSLVAGIAV
jgi:hypothetical protein